MNIAQSAPIGTQHRNCLVSGCRFKQKARGFCNTHYERWRVSGNPSRIGTPKGALQEFLTERVFTYDADDCLEWPFGKDDNGYGVVQYKGKRDRAHRIACIHVNGEPPTPEHVAAHNCGDSSCVNPRHIRWATPMENEADKLVHGTKCRGVRHGNAKLTEADVRAIRKLDGLMLHREIAERFSLSRTYVGRIIRREAWAWLKE